MLTEHQPVGITKDELLLVLPATLSDLKHHRDPAERAPSNANIRRDLYRHVTREMFSERRFLSKEDLPNGQQGLFIKGYVRDVWAYLDDAYDLIHGIDFETEFTELIASNGL